MTHDWIQIKDPVSTVAGDVDLLFWSLTALCGLTAFLIIGLLIIFSVKYRRRPGVTPQAAGLTGKRFFIETVWIGVPLVTFMVIFVWGAKLYFRQIQVPDHALQIYATAKQWMWKFQHPQGPREIDELHVPVGVPVQVTLISQDVIHSFFVPDMRMKMDVLPERYTTVWFQIRKPGVYPLYCAEYCGLWHSAMRGRIIALPQSEYDAWLTGRKTQTMALRGQRVFERLNCIQCHAKDSVVAAPVLNGLWGRKVQLAEGGAVYADEAYIRESIIYPSRRLVSGYQNVMPAYKDQVKEEELLDLIAFIKSLNAPPDDMTQGDKRHVP